MKKLNKTTHKMNILKKRAISMITATALLMASIPMSEISDGIRKLSDTFFSPITASAYQKYNCYDYTTIDDATGYIKIGSWQNLADYSKAYYEASYGTFGEGVSHQNDTILIAIGSDAGNDVDLAGLYEPIGNSLEPFCGKIVFEAGSPNTFNLDCPIFGEVYDSVEIVQSDETTPKQINITRTLDKPGVPLIANKVKSNGGGAEWNVQFTMLSTYSTRVVQYGGAIGEIESGASLNLTFANNAVIGDNKVNLKTNASTDDGSGYPVDAGVLCGHLDGTLVATYSGTNYNYSVTSENGNAGGLVGSMGSGASLTISATAYTDSDYSGVNLQRANALVEADNGYAGGIVGRNNGGTVTMNVTGSPSTYDIKQFITGSSGAGGIYGYYAPPKGTTNFDVTKFNVDCKVASLTSNAGYVGGIIGEMETAASSTVTFQGAATVTSHNTDHDSKGVISNAYGGLIGKYKAASTSNTLNINSLTAVADNSLETVIYGGAIGKIDSGSYVNFDTFTLTSADGNLAGTFGGIAADAEGAYIYAKDVTIGSTLEGGAASISEFTGGGLVGKLGNGVLGMTGTIDVSKATPTAADANGQIVGSRDNALIYAENIAATETEAASSWSYTPNSSKVDNIGSWGDVMVFGTNLAKADVFASENGHVISLKAVNTSDIDSVADYAITSILFQLNPSKNAFLSGTRLDDDVSLTFTDDVDLSGTGLRGITRDDGDSTKVVGTTYKGTATGTSGKTITLDIKNVGGKPVYYHTYLGLFGRTQSAILDTLALSGTIYVENNKKDSGIMYVGAGVAQASGTFTASNCSTAEYTENDGVETGLKLNITGGSPVQCGRLLGDAPDKIGAITISNGVFDGKITGTASGANTHFGGVIGQLGKPDANVTWSFSNLSIKGTVESTVSTKADQKIAGVIASLNGNNKATINLSNIYYDGFTLSGTASSTQGGLLGYIWDNADVNIANVSLFADSDSDEENDLTASTVEAKGAGGAAGLVYRATGHWEVSNVDLTGIIMKAGSAGSVGMIVNKGTDGSGNGIYLVLPSGYDYKLSFADGSSVASSVTANKFDELCAFSATNGAVMTNGQGIVSISSTGGLVMSSTAADSLTYKPRTTQGQTRNPNTRYYYNLDTMDKRTGNDISGTPAMQLMNWGLYHYACSNIRGNFVNSNLNQGLTYNMAGYSWYPITLDTSAQISGTYWFYNKEFEGCETASGSVTNGVTWSSLAKTQHYMMQNGLFYNVTSNLTIGAVTLKGTVGAVGTDGTGALVYGTVNGSSSASNDITVIDSTGTGSSISLDGIKIWNYKTVSENYAPLLINKTGSFVNLKISNVSTTSTYGAGDEAATSLIGYAGASDTDTYITVDFTKIKLDARTDSGTPALSAHGYPTTKSIFTRATLLERLVGESGTYTYTYDDDWGTGNHNVTYGEEVGYTKTNKSTSQYPEQEQWYARASTSATKYATSYSAAPTNDTITDTGFGSFLPYVKIVSTAENVTTEKHYQLKVNHQPTDVIEGCGTYNDPYILKTEADIVKISRWISGNDLTTANINANFGDTWCDNKTEHSVYNGSSSGFTNAADSTDTRTNAAMRQYLCEAYYKIDPLSGNSITLSANSNFRGLGIKDAGYRFRGVIVGGDNISIINKTAFPLIAYSEGSVVKNLTITVDTSDLYINKENTYKGQIYFNGMPGVYTNWNNTSEFPRNSYGSVIATIVGGDNIIDNVQVNLNSAKFYFNGSNAQYTAIGGYVGVIIDGGLVFRNMSGSISGLTDNTKITNNQSKTTDTMINSDNNVWMFVNPIIGRVINGYAVTESIGGYKAREADVTMKNSTGDHDVVKNYSITDIATTGGTLTVDSSAKTIAVPDSQAFVLMSYIVNSGMGSNLLGYSATSGTNYFMRRHASYSDVRSTATASSSCSDYTNYASLDSLSSTPYLIYKYAGGNASIGSDSWTVNLATGDSYDLSDGFRGIGNFFYNDDNLRLNISAFNGNGSTINQNTKYYYYSSDCANDYRPYNHQNSGIALINCLNTNCSFSDLILTGSVKCDAILKDADTDNNLAAGDHIYYKTEVTNNDRHLSAAMLLATVKENIYPTIDSVALQNVNVRGVRHTGGLIGNLVKTGSKIVKITNEEEYNSYGITVHGAGSVAGLIGRNQEGLVQVDLNNCHFNIVEIVSECSYRYTDAHNTSNDNKSDYNYGVGGFIGICRTGGTPTTANKFENIKIGTSESTAVIQCTDGGTLFTGGVIGVINRANVDVSNCEFYNLSVESNYVSGGLVADCITASTPTVKNTKLISNKNSVINAATSSGGFIGNTDERGDGGETFVLRDSEITGYTISGTASSGGVIGYRGAKNDNAILQIENVKVDDCTIKSNTSAGVIAGEMKHPIQGYNILCNDIGFGTVSGSGSITNNGYIVGLNPDSKNIKLVGFSRQEELEEGEDSEMIQDIVGNGGVGANGYVIFADYNGVVSDQDWTTDVDIATGLSEVAKASPYVNTNPKTEIDASSTPKFLTSDGANLTAVTQIMDDIEDTSHPAGYYDIASSVESSLSNKVSSFVDEMGTKPISIGGRDFPVLIVDDINEVNTTKRINDYIALLTNNASGNFNYASTADSKVFKTVIHRCTYDSDGEILTIKPGQTAAYSDASASNNNYPSLKRNSQQFYMNANDTDSKEENAQFTLIDIQYLDPSESGKIVYHLYVPVYVRKVLQYDFNIHVDSGTTYKVNTPANITKNTLLENIGTPITLEFAFTYDRDADEWKTAVNGGDSLLTNYPKKLKFDNSTEADGTKPNLPAGTKMVLIDSQDYSKPYYLDDIYANIEDGNPAFRGSDSEKYLYLNGFTDGTEYFSPKNFNDLMIVTVVEDENGTLVDNTEHPKDGYPAIVTDNSGESLNGKSFRYYSASDTSYTRYSVSSISFKNSGTKLVEHYFVSIYTPYSDADTVFHYSISAGKDLGTDPYPSRVTKASENNAVNLFMGNIYDQEIRINSQSVGGVDGKQILSASGNDNQLTADLTAKVTLTQSAKDNGIKTYLGDPTTAPDIYESLLIQFNKHTATDNDIGIKGVEDVDVSTYTINGTSVRTLNPSWSKSNNIKTNLSFIELSNDHPLARNLYNSDTVTINAVATVTFNKDSGISQQFYPETPDTRRTNLIALSRISSDSSTVAYSKVSVQTNKIWDPVNEEESEDTYQYYTEDTEEAIITHEALEMSDGQLPQLGINANDPNDQKKLPSPIHTIGTYGIEKCPTSWENAEYIVCELELKTIDSNYTSKLPIFKYIEPSSFKILDGITPTSIVYLDGSGNTVTPTVVDEETVLPITTHTIRVTYTKAALSNKLDEDIYQIPIEFKVYSGSAFEDESLTYANFGLYLYVYMLDSSKNTITVTTTPSGGDYVKYTNARIYLEKVDPSKAS